MAYVFRMGQMELPVTPKKMKIKVNGKNETVSLISGQEINLLKKPGLTDIEFEMMIPQVQYPFASKLRPAEEYFKVFENFIISKTPFPFMVCRTLPNGQLLFGIDIKVALDSYDITEDAAEGWDLMVNIKLKQYVDYQTEVKNLEEVNGKRVAVTEPHRPLSPEAPSREIKNYIVKKGDTLWAICKLYLGDGSKYREIAARNSIKNPSEIKVGQVIRLG